MDAIVGNVYIKKFDSRFLAVVYFIVMKIIFSNHAEVKIEQRKLSKELINKTIVVPDFIVPSHGNRERAYKKFGNNYLEVVFIKENEIIVIITAHWVAKLKK